MFTDRLSMKFLACILSLWFCRLESALIQKRTATINTTMTSNPPNTPLHHDDLIPLPAFDKHKGQMGRICVIGGSVQYTGATFYASMSSLTAGADLVHVVCSEGAVPILKNYSPELIVLPHYLDRNDSVDHIMSWMNRMHSVLIGPGLGTEPLVQSNVISIIHKLKAANLNVPLVIDADGLKLVAEHPGLIQDYRGPVYLTPNKREYENLLSGSEVNAAYIKQGHPNLTVIVKGHEDVIKNNQISLTCKEGNSWRRCGGQGDLVAGTLATFAHYAALKEQNATGHQGWKALAGLCACAVVRRSNLLAFQIKRRSMVATDMLDQLHVALKQYFRNW